jgi:hypothetical protein
MKKEEEVKEESRIILGGDGSPLDNVVLHDPMVLPIDKKSNG